MPVHAHSDFREWAGAGGIHEDGECGYYRCHFPYLPIANRGFYRSPNTMTRVRAIQQSRDERDSDGS